MLDLTDDSINLDTSLGGCSVDELTAAVFAIGNNLGSWRQAPAREMRACVRVLREVCLRDPTNRGALWLFMQEDFLARANQVRPKGSARIWGPPVAPPDDALVVARIEDLLSRFARDHEQPTGLFVEMDTLPVTSSDVLTALIRGLHAPAWRAQLACIDALARTRIDHPRVVVALLTRLAEIVDEDSDAPVDEYGTNTGPHLVDKIAMGFHYGLKANGAAGFAAFAALARQKIDALSDSDGDWHHVWPINTMMSLALHQGGDDRTRAHALIERLLDDARAAPPWKQARLGDLLREGPGLVAALARPHKRPRAP